VAADRTQGADDLARMRELTAEHQRRNELRDDMPGRGRRFSAVERIRVGDTFPNADRAVVFDRDQHEGAFVNAAEAGLEEADQREAEPPQLDSVDAHV
jgi:hypothetical protein